jgi:hypothetical protein
MLGHASASNDADADLSDDDLTPVADALDHRAMPTDVAILLPGALDAACGNSGGNDKTPGCPGVLSSVIPAGFEPALPP